MAKMITLSAYDCVEVDGYLYFFSLDYNFFFKMEISTGKISIVDSIPEEKIFAGMLCSKIIHHNGYLYFAPLNATKIWRYSLGDGKWKDYELKNIKGYIGKQAFLQAVLYSEKIYFFGCRYPAVVVLDLNSEEISYYDGMYTNQLKQLSVALNDAFFLKSCVRIDNYVYMASCLYNAVLKFNMDTCMFEYIRVGDDNNRYSGIGYDGSYFYLSPRVGLDAVKWNEETGHENIRLIYSNVNEKYTIGGVCCYKDKAVFYGFPMGRSIVIDTNNTEFGSSDRYWFCENVDDDVNVCLNNEGKVTIKKGNDVFEYELRVEKDLIEERIEKSFKEKGVCAGVMLESDGNGVLIENESFSLRLFTKVL